MILIFGIPSEPPIELLKNELDGRNYPYLMLNQRRIKDIQIELSPHASGVDGILTYGGLSYNISTFSGLYIRSMDNAKLPELQGSTDNDLLEHARRVTKMIWEWSDVALAKVVNSRKSMASNGSKPYQGQLIKKAGLQIPPTLISNDTTEVRAFHQRYGKVIYKSASGVRSIVRELDINDADRLRKIANCPTQFQAYIDGTDWRVHVIDETVIATKIQSNGVDYRYAHKEGKSTNLSAGEIPADIRQKCIDLNRMIGLHFGGIDLRIDRSGQVYCFEVNPSPAYSYYQNSTGQNIARHLADFLVQ